MEDDGFQLVLRKRKKKLPNVTHLSYARRFDNISLEQISSVVEKAVAKMRYSMNMVIEMIKDVPAYKQNGQAIQIRAIGVGNFSGCEAQDYGCHQLALLLLLKEYFDCEVSFQDPVTTENEKLWLQSRNISWLKATALDNCNACSNPGYLILFYMPHCDVALYNSLIYAHRSKLCLEKIVILGNNLVSFRVNAKYKNELSVLLAYREVCKCLPLPVYDGSPFSFNDTAIHFLDKVHPEVQDKEPHYDFYKILYH
uniref:SRR1 domain-containing protein n=1 Tax=Syphacia muris TaxID=451379 RepID=A0A0N5ADC8_9BILA